MTETKMALDCGHVVYYNMDNSEVLEKCQEGQTMSLNIIKILKLGNYSNHIPNCDIQ